MYTSEQLDIESLPVQYDSCSAKRLDEEFDAYKSVKKAGMETAYFDFEAVCRNPNSLHIISKMLNDNNWDHGGYYDMPYYKKLDWVKICENPHLIEIIFMIFNRDVDHHLLYWEAICKNEGAYPILDKIYKTEGLTSTKLYLNHLLNNSGTFDLIDTILSDNIDDEYLWIQCAYEGNYNIKDIALKLKSKEWCDEHVRY